MPRASNKFSFSSAEVNRQRLISALEQKGMNHERLARMMMDVIEHGSRDQKNVMINRVFDLLVTKDLRARKRKPPKQAEAPKPVEPEPDPDAIEDPEWLEQRGGSTSGSSERSLEAVK